MDNVENQISYDVRGAIFKVYNNLGPGLFESVYETALSYEIEKLGYSIKRQVVLPFVYEEIYFEQGFRIDILVEDKVIIELKSVESLANVHYKQVLTYLKLSNKKLGILVNFNSEQISDSIKRVVNNL
ncbi:GxxExxY protein [uncultured Draconibacterium sp.]|uniref:GxxExxY protein n=1 Tax=uncultured Draconibacterium sp. TaxID=1573823 RepID=UPI0032178D6B